MSGFAIASVGVALLVNEGPARRQEPARDPAVYYASWLRTEEQRCRRRLEKGQSVTLRFEPASRNVLHVVTNGFTPAAREQLVEGIRKSFERQNPGSRIEIQASEAVQAG